MHTRPGPQSLETRQGTHEEVLVSQTGVPARPWQSESRAQVPGVPATQQPEAQRWPEPHAESSMQVLAPTPQPELTHTLAWHVCGDGQSRSRVQAVRLPRPQAVVKSADSAKQIASSLAPRWVESSTAAASPENAGAIKPDG